MPFLVHNFERRARTLQLPGVGRLPILPCVDWIDVECIDCGATWIAEPGAGRGRYECVGQCEGLMVSCRNCEQTAEIPVPR